jgi:simple sugar transport system ATP-binding protein
VSQAAPALALAGITKRFGQLAALDGADLVVHSGTVHAVLGENGAGKTTLMRIAFGLLAPDAGQIAVRGVPVCFASPGDAIASGIGMVHQHFTNVGAMTVAENIALGRHGLLHLRDVVEELAMIGRRTGLVLDPDSRAGDLSVSAQQRLEIVKALTRDATILILDEPTAVLAPAEIEDLLRWIRRFVDSGGTVLMITHKLREALAVSDTVTVLRRGRTVMTSLATEIDLTSLATAMVGKASLGSMHTPEVASVASVLSTALPLVRAKGMTLVNERGAAVLYDAAFEIHPGEIVGIAAVEGSGQRELLRALAGRLHPMSGTLERPRSVGFVPEDRHRDALVLDFSATANIALRGAGARRGRMHWGLERDRAARLIDTFNVRGAAETPARQLSGGNQQKLVLARELEGEPDLLVVENPTRGLDIRATEAVHANIRAAASRSAAVVIYSSDLDEVLSLATRMLVVHAGRLVETDLNREAVGRAMLGAA